MKQLGHKRAFPNSCFASISGIFFKIIALISASFREIIDIYGWCINLLVSLLDTFFRLNYFLSVHHFLFAHFPRPGVIEYSVCAFGNSKIQNHI